MSFKNFVENFGKHLPMDESIESATKIFDEFLETNDMDRALGQLGQSSPQSIYHSTVRVFLRFLTLATLVNEHDFRDMENYLDDAYKVSVNNCKRSKLIRKPFGKTYYNKLTDLQVHAQLFKTLNLGIQGLYFLATCKTTPGLIKCSRLILQEMSEFRKCKMILKKRTNWQSQQALEFFSSGVTFIEGLTIFIIKQFPHNIQKYVRFSKQNELDGLEKMCQVGFCSENIFARLSRLFLLYICLYWKTHYGVSKKFIGLCKVILDKDLKLYPNVIIIEKLKKCLISECENLQSILHLAAFAKLNQINGDIDNSIKIYKGLLNSYNYLWFPYVIKHELVFCYAIKQEWEKCLINMEHFNREDMIHYPAYLSYFMATLYLIKVEDDYDHDIIRKVSDIMSAIPLIRTRTYGPVITLGKFAVARSKQYLSNPELLALPEMEIFYQNNFAMFIQDNQTLMNNLVERVDNIINKIEAKRDKFGHPPLDYYLTAKFYRGYLNRLNRKYELANSDFVDILLERKNMDNKWLISATFLELGLNEYDQGNYDDAKIFLKKCNRYLKITTNHLWVITKALSGLREIRIARLNEHGIQSLVEKYQAIMEEQSNC